MRALLASVFFLLASCSTEIVETLPQPCDGPCETSDECAQPESPCVVASCIAGACSTLLADGASCATDAGDDGSCNAGTCE